MSKPFKHCKCVCPWWHIWYLCCAVVLQQAPLEESDWARWSSQEGKEAEAYQGIPLPASGENIREQGGVGRVRELGRMHSSTALQGEGHCQGQQGADTQSSFREDEQETDTESS